MCQYRSLSCRELSGAETGLRFISLSLNAAYGLCRYVTFDTAFLRIWARCFTKHHTSPHCFKWNTKQTWINRKCSLIRVWLMPSAENLVHSQPLNAFFLVSLKTWCFIFYICTHDVIGICHPSFCENYWHSWQKASLFLKRWLQIKQ